MYQLLLTALGGAVALTGTFVGHRWQAAEARRIRFEDHAREDRYRHHAARTETYIRFVAAFTRAREAAFAKEQGHEDPEQLRLTFLALMDVSASIQIIGTPEASAAASPITSAVSAYTLSDGPYLQEDWREITSRFLEVARAELVPTAPMNR